MKCHVVVEEGPISFGACVPHLPGCCSVAAGRGEVLKLIQEAIEIHVEGMTEQGGAVPVPHSSGELIDVAA